MNTHLKFDFDGRSFLRAGISMLGLATLFNVVSAQPDVTAGSNPGGQKTHTLFMGADFDVQQNRKFWRVEGVAGSSFIINENNEKIFIPTESGALAMKVYSELKLAASSATVTGYQAERSYTHETDPRTKFVRENPGMTQDAQRDIGIANEVYGTTNARLPQAQGESAADYKKRIDYDHSLARAEVVTGTNALSFDQSTSAFVNRMESDLEKELFDAMEVRFTVSSPKKLTDPYIVLVAQYREKSEKTGTAHSWIYAHQLRPIDAHPRGEYILQGGLPPGFELLGCELHLYNRGQEVGTTVSPKRVELTRDEAFEYLLIDYIGSHRGATLTAAPFMGVLPADLTTKLTADQLRASYFVKISDDGVPLGIYADEACQRKLNDPYIEDVIGHLRFKPALEKGKAIPGVARVKLDHLSLQA